MSEHEKCYAQSLPVGTLLRTSHFRCMSFSHFSWWRKEIVTLLWYDQNSEVRGTCRPRKRHVSWYQLSVLFSGQYRLTRNMKLGAQQRGRNVQDRNKEDSEDGTEDVNKEMNGNNHGRRKGTEKWRLKGKSNDKIKDGTKEVEEEGKWVEKARKKQGRKDKQRKEKEIRRGRRCGMQGKFSSCGVYRGNSSSIITNASV